MKTKRKRKNNGRLKPSEVVTPLRHSLTDAALLLGTSKNKLRGMAVDEKEFTVVRDEIDSNGPVGTKIYLLADEIAAYATSGLTGLRAFRKAKGRVS